MMADITSEPTRRCRRCGERRALAAFPFRASSGGRSASRAITNMSASAANGTASRQASGRRSGSTKPQGGPDLRADWP